MDQKDGSSDKGMTESESPVEFTHAGWSWVPES